MAVRYPSNSSRNGAVLATAATVAAMTIYNVLRARKTERDHPPRGRFATVDGVRLHYLERGTGTPVVLLHGNVVDAYDFDLSGVLGLAARDHRVIAFDRPGFGYSARPYGEAWSPAAQAQLLRKAFAALSIDRPVVVGHSFGAVVALALALDHPDAVSGLVLLSGYYHPTLRADALLAIPQALPAIGDAIRYTVSPLAGAMMLPLLLKRMFSPAPLPERFTRGFVRGMAVRPWQIRAESQDGAAMVPAAAAMRNRYRELELPTVIMAGTEDRIVDFKRHAAQLHEEIPHSILRLIPGAGHMLHYAVPDRVVQGIEAVFGQRIDRRDHQDERKGNFGRT